MAFADQNYDTDGQDYETADDLYGTADQIRQGVEVFRAASAVFDARYYSGDDAATLITILTEGENLICSMKMQCAKRVEETRLYEKDGHLDAASLISQLTGQPVGRARSSLDLAKASDEHPVIADALKNGKLTESQLKEVTSAADANPDKAEDLVKAAADKTFGELKDTCQRVKARALSGTDSESRRKKMRKERFFRTWVDTDGFGHVQAKLMADQLSILRAALEPFREAIRDQARNDEEYASYEQYSADALIEMAKAAGSGEGSKTPKPLIRFRVNLEAFVRGHAEDGEVSEAMGTGTVPISVISEYAQDAIFELVALWGTKVDSVVTSSRHIPRVVQIALEEAGRVCSHEGCNISFPLQIDHMEEVRHGGLTKYENLTFVCPRHHHLKTNKKWVWEGPPGHRKLVPPKTAEPAERPDHDSLEDPPPDDPGHFQGSFEDGEDP